MQLKKAVPGYVRIDASCLRELNNQPNQRHVLETVRKFVRADDGYLMKKPFKDWIHWQLDRVFDGLTKLPHKRGYYQMSTNGFTYQVE